MEKWEADKFVIGTFLCPTCHFPRASWGSCPPPNPDHAIKAFQVLGLPGQLTFWGEHFENSRPSRQRFPRSEAARLTSARWASWCLMSCAPPSLLPVDQPQSAGVFLPSLRKCRKGKLVNEATRSSSAAPQRCTEGIRATL